MVKILLTGGRGLLGSHLIPALLGRGISIIGLDRSNRLGRADLMEARVETVRGDILDPGTYRSALPSTQTVVHLAAATGRASAQEHFEVNYRGTELLLEQCLQAGVQRFLFISSIAVKFPDKHLYHYAKAKEQAEQAVQKSGLDFAIVRPTIILGRNSGPLSALTRLARMPVVPIFGNGRAKVQPIFVKDLAALLVELLEKPLLGKEIIELGGPTVLSIEDLLLKIRQAVGTRKARTVHVPLRPILLLLGAFERLGVRGLPLTAGQLSSFRYDGTIEPSAFHEKYRATLKTVPEMLSIIFSE